VIVTATSTVKPSARATAAVTLPTVPFSITPAAIAVAPGATHTFSATITGLSSNQVNWAVQGTGGGTITNAGLYTAPAAIGTVHLIATSAANANYTTGAVVVVTNNPHSFLPAGDLQSAR
jgi:chitinase